jgi:hypothetical protein
MPRVKRRKPWRPQHAGNPAARPRRPHNQPITAHFAFHVPRPTIQQALVKNLLRKFWSILAALAGALLIYFEWHRAGGITADNIFWLLIAALIVILATINLIQKPSQDGHDASADNNLPLH